MSRRKGANVVVTARQCRGNHEKMIRKFIKKCKKEKVVERSIVSALIFIKSLLLKEERRNWKSRD